MAWWEGGHFLVANIAYDLLEEADREDIVNVLRKHPRWKQDFLSAMPDDVRKADKSIQNRWIFMQAAVWPDVIRRTRPYDHPSWHYINQPFFPTETDKKALEKLLDHNTKLELPANIPLNSDPQELNAVQALQLVRQRLANKKISEERKAVYYCWLFHLVGDVHQPMHSTSLFSRGRFPSDGGDRGGNGIPVKQRRNLHSLWDSLPGERLKINEVRGKTVRYLSAPGAKDMGKSAAKNLHFADWVQESHKLAKQHVYSEQILQEVRSKDANPDQPLAKIDLPETYLKNAGTIAQQRVVQAGYRLSALLKDIPKEE